MKKILAALMIASVSMAYESTLTTDAVLIVPSVSTLGTYADRQASETITNGNYRKIGATVVVAQNDGITDGTMATNSVVTANTDTLIVTGTLSPDATGTYLKTPLNTYTNTGKAWMIYQSAGQYRLVTNSNYRIATTNKFYASSLVGSYTNGGAYTGVATVVYQSATTEVVTAVAPTLNASGVTTDGSINWLRVPASRKRIVFSVLEGDAVLSNAAGDKIYKGTGLFELDFDGAIYGASTNNAKVDVFAY